MIHIFYILALFPIMWEIIVSSSPRKVSNFVKEFKGLSMDESTSEQKTLANFMLVYLIWNIIGLFTGQWMLFIIILGLGIIPKNNVFLTFINGFVSLCILVFMLINQYHLHIDLFKMIFK